MSNHYHLLIETPQPNLSKIMHYINRSYTTYYNIKRKKTGHLFQGRYKSLVVERDSYFLALSRYMHLNPVRAGMVKRPHAYTWSSYNGYLDKKGDGCIDKEQIDLYLDMKPHQYEQFVLDGIGKKNNPFEKVYAGFILGTTQFIKDTLNGLKLRVEADEVSYRKIITKQVTIEEITEAVARKYGNNAEELYNAKKKPLLAKKIAVYLSKRLTGQLNREIADKFMISYSAVSKAAKDIERLVGENRRVKKDVEMLISHFKG